MRATWLLPAAMAPSGCVLLDWEYDVAPAAATSTGASATGSGGVSAGGSTSSISTSTSGGAGGSTGGSGGAAGGGGEGGAGGAPSFCGDGTIDAGEECDDANATDADGCTTCVVDCASPAFKDPMTFHCYRVFKTSEQAWSLARAACLDAGFDDLAAPSTIAEIQLIEPKIDVITWVGGTDALVEGTFEWTNGEPFTFATGMAPWKGGQSTGGTAENCMLLEPVSGGVFWDYVCSVPLDYVCERKPAGMP